MDAMDASAVIWDPRGRGEDEGARRRAASATAAARWRGAIGLLVGLAVAIRLYRWSRLGPACAVAAIALLFALVAFVSPLGIYPRVQAVLDRFAHAVGAALTWVLMTLLFFLFVLPVGALLRAAGKLGITKGFDRDRATYWSEPGRPAGADAYRKQF